MSEFIVVPRKFSHYSNFIIAIYNELRNSNNEGMWDNQLEAFKYLDMLREHIRRNGSKIHALRRYHYALVSFKNHIPIEHYLPNIIRWRNAFDIMNSLGLQSIRYEANCFLFNIAAHYSIYGNSDGPDEGNRTKLTKAITCFQTAAGIFSYLKNAAPLEIWTLDLHPLVLRILRELMVVQAQELMYKKASLDNIPHGNIAAIAQTIASSNASLMGFMQENEVMNIWPEEWIPLIQCKKIVYKALDHYHRSKADGVHHGGIEQFIRLREASRLMDEAEIKAGPRFIFATIKNSINSELGQLDIADVLKVLNLFISCEDLASGRTFDNPNGLRFIEELASEIPLNNLNDQHFIEELTMEIQFQYPIDTNFIEVFESMKRFVVRQKSMCDNELSRLENVAEKLDKVYRLSQHPDEVDEDDPDEVDEDDPDEVDEDDPDEVDEDDPDEVDEDDPDEVDEDDPDEVDEDDPDEVDEDDPDEVDEDDPDEVDEENIKFIRSIDEKIASLQRSRERFMRFLNHRSTRFMYNEFYSQIGERNVQNEFIRNHNEEIASLEQFREIAMRLSALDMYDFYSQMDEGNVENEYILSVNEEIASLKYFLERFMCFLKDRSTSDMYNEFYSQIGEENVENEYLNTQFSIIQKEVNFILNRQTQLFTRIVDDN